MELTPNAQRLLDELTQYTGVSASSALSVAVLMLHQRTFYSPPQTNGARSTARPLKGPGENRGKRSPGKPVIAYDSHGAQVGRWPSVNAAARTLNVNSMGIRSGIDRPDALRYGLRWVTDTDSPGSTDAGSTDTMEENSMINITSLKTDGRRPVKDTDQSVLNDILNDAQQRFGQGIDTALQAQGKAVSFSDIVQGNAWWVHHTGGGCHALSTSSGGAHGAYVLITDEDGQIPESPGTYDLSVTLEQEGDEIVVVYAQRSGHTQTIQTSEKGKSIW